MSIRPGQTWLDTSGNRIQAHGGSVVEDDGMFFWYGENKERTVPGSDIWHWGVRLYRSRDLESWEDLGVVIPPDESDPTSPLHPRQGMDRPHILRRSDGTWVCWLKVMTRDAGQRSSVLVADRLTGPWTLVRTGLRPLGMHAGDFDLVVDPYDGKGYYYFERVHSELVCADLTDDLTDVTGYYSTHFPLIRPPYVREAPAYFRRRGRHYLLTSGTTGYVPNPSQVAVADTYHGPWKVLGDPHPADRSRTSWCSQISSVFRHPHKQDLYIALADRWLPGLLASPHLRSGQFSDDVTRYTASIVPGQPRPEPPPSLTPDVLRVISEEHTALADYVWLPVRFEGEQPVIDWRDEWSVDEFA